jgi:hypothetical protein
VGALRGLAKKFANRPAGVTLNSWVKKEFPERWKIMLNRRPGEDKTPSEIIKSTRYRKGDRERKFVPPYSEGPSADGATSGPTFFSTTFTSEGSEWGPLLGHIKKVASRDRTNAEGDTVRGVGWANLLAVLWARGFTSRQIQDDINSQMPLIVNQTAQALSNYTSGTLDAWFRETYGAPSGRILPDKVLEGQHDGRGIPVTGREGDVDVVHERDRLDPEVFTTTTGQLVRQSDYDRLFSRYSDLSQWYRGTDPTFKEVQDWTNKGLSDYAITMELSSSPGFFRSPAWKKSSVTYKGIFRDTIGTDQRMPKQLIRKAILHSWNEGDFSEALRGRPEYLEGNEFQSQVSHLHNLYSTVQGGTITSGVKTALKEAALARWSDNQFTSWLRAQPEYETGREHTKKVQGLNAVFAAFSGTSLKRVEVPVPEPVAAFDLPDSDRIFGEGDLSQDIDVRPAESVANPRGEVA